MLFSAAAADAVMQVDQVPAGIAGVRRDLLAQQCLSADLAHPRGIAKQIDPVSVAVSLAERFHPLAGTIHAVRTGEQPALHHTRAHDALALVIVRLALSRAAARARLLAEMAVAEHAVQSAGGEHIDVYGVRWFHAATYLSKLSILRKQRFA
jgi:hypothetical protein